MARFVATPEVGTGLPEWALTMLSALKENVELLTDTRGEADAASKAIVQGDVTVDQLGDQAMGTVTYVVPDGYTILGSDVADLAAFRALRDDVQVLANDLYVTRLVLNKLIESMGD